MLRDQKDEGAKPQPPKILNFRAEKGPSFCLLMPYHFLSPLSHNISCPLYSPPVLYSYLVASPTLLIFRQTLVLQTRYQHKLERMILS